MRRLWILISIISLLSSCKKIDYNNPVKKESISIEEAKAIFNTKLSLLDTFDSLSYLFKTDTKRKALNWKDAKVSSDEKFSVVEIPIVFDKDFIFNKTIKNAPLFVSKLLFLKEKVAGKVHIAIYSVAPDNEKLSQENFGYKRLPANFNGYVIFSNWDGKFNNAWKYKDGRAANKVTNSKESITNSYVAEDCQSYIMDTWERLCYDNYNGETYCTPWTLIYSRTIQVCGGSGGGGEYQTTTITQEDLENYLADHIDNEISKPCVNSIFNELLNNPAFKFSKIIKDFSGEDPHFNWRFFILPTTPPPGQNAGTGGEMNEGHWESWLYNDKLNNASDLSIARSMIHEAIHAHLLASYSRDNTYGKSYPELLAYRRQLNNPNINAQQHFFMEKEFVNTIIFPALKAFGQTRGYTLDDQFYKDLSWGGLDFENNSSLDETDKERINNVLRAELDNNANDGTTQKGRTPCKMTVPD